jgi:hypothetical protein
MKVDAIILGIHAWSKEIDGPVNPRSPVPDNSARVFSLTAVPETTPVGWSASPIWTGDMSGPVDGLAHPWWSPAFDDTTWASIGLPDQRTDNNADDRYYRGHFTSDGKTAYTLHLASDDGLSLWLNGTLVGTWGGAWRQGGCVNEPTQCPQGNTSVPDQPLPSALIHAGDNVIAVDVWNAKVCCYSSFDATLLPQRMSQARLRR